MHAAGSQLRACIRQLLPVYTFVPMWRWGHTNRTDVIKVMLQGDVTLCRVDLRGGLVDVEHA
jgi:hypothetical protein